MSKIRLWGHPKSINVQKVLWALDELDLEFQGVDAGGKFGRVKDADYLILNPNGLVPTLEDGPLIIQLSAPRVRAAIGRPSSNHCAAQAQPSPSSIASSVANRSLQGRILPSGTFRWPRWHSAGSTCPSSGPPANAVQAWYDRVKRRPGFRRWVDQPLS